MTLFLIVAALTLAIALMVGVIIAEIAACVDEKRWPDGIEAMYTTILAGGVIIAVLMMIWVMK